MNAHPSSTNSLHRLVILIITCALLWTQFLGLKHSISHSWSPIAANADLAQTSPKDTFGQQIQKFSGKGLSNSSISHNCLAWDACSLTTAVFLSTLVQFTSSLVFFLSPPKFLPNFSYKLPRYFFSRAPPKLHSH